MARQYTSRTKKSGLDVTVTSKLDISGLQQLKKILKQVPSVEAGYLNGTKHPVWDLTFAQIAFINEFGVPGYGANPWHIPPRPFMKQTFKANKGFVKELHIALSRSIGTLKQPIVNKEMRKFGAKMADRINLMVSGGDFIDNAAVTIAMKGRNDPLNWTGHFRKAAKFRIVR